MKVKKLDRLENLDHGLWQGLLVDEVRQKQPKVYRQWLEQPETICPPEGETIDHARERIQGVLAKLLKKHADGVIGLVVPEPLASVVRSELCHTDLGDLWRATCEHGCWTVINIGKNGEATVAAETVRNGTAQDRPEPTAAATNGNALTGSKSAVEVATTDSRNGKSSHTAAESHRSATGGGRRKVQAEGAATGGAHAADSLAPLPAQIFP